MQTKKLATSAAAALVAIGLAVTPALPAAAVGGSITGSKTCSNPSVPHVRVQSTSKGNINHWGFTVLLDHWANGSTYTTRVSYTTYNYLDWKVSLTGMGGDISYGNAVCGS